MDMWHRIVLANARYAPAMPPFLVRAGLASAQRLGTGRALRALHARSAEDRAVFGEPALRARLHASLGPPRPPWGATGLAASLLREAQAGGEDWGAELVACRDLPIRLTVGEDDPQAPRRRWPGGAGTGLGWRSRRCPAAGS
jgi:hypothetical protein